MRACRPPARVCVGVLAGAAGSGGGGGAPMPGSEPPPRCARAPSKPPPPSRPRVRCALVKQQKEWANGGDPIPPTDLSINQTTPTLLLSVSPLSLLSAPWSPSSSATNASRPPSPKPKSCAASPTAPSRGARRATRVSHTLPVLLILVFGGTITLVYALSVFYPVAQLWTALLPD